MNEEPKKPGEIAKTLDVSTVTIRNYVREFSQFLSPSATAKTNRKFTPEDVRTLTLATSLLRDGSTYDEVRQQLTERLPLEGDVFEGKEPEETYQEPSAIQPLEFFQAFVDQLSAEHQATITAKDETIETLKEDKERLQAEVDWLRLPWYKKLFRGSGE